MDPLTLGLITGGVQAIGAVGGWFGQQDAARAENKRRIQQYKQQMLIRNVRDMGRFGIYRQKRDVIYKENLTALSRRYAMQQKQDELRMNELLKGAKLGTQNDLVNQVESAGKIMAGTTSGQSQAKLKQSAMAKIGRATALREDKLMSSVYAKEMKDEADLMTLNAARMKEFSKVQFAPQESIPQSMGAMVDGPSPMSLIAGIGNAALSGLSAGMGQANFDKQILSQKPANVQLT